MTRLTRRRGVAAAIAALATAGLITGCSPSAPSTGGSQTSASCKISAPKTKTDVNVLAFSAPAIDPFTNSMVGACRGLENLSVNHTPVDFAAQLQKANLALSSGTDSPYDIVEVYDGTLVEYASKGWLAPLDDLIAKYRTEYQLDDVPAGLWKEFSYEGKTYGVPNQQNVQILIYRKDVFDKVGLQPPTTYAELLAAAAKIRDGAKDLVKYPLVMAWGADEAITNGFNNALNGYGGEWFGKDGKPSFAGPEGVAALDAMRSLYAYMPKEALTFDNGAAMTAMQQGQAAMTVIWASRATPILDTKASRVADKIAFAPAPKGVAEGRPASSWSQDGFAIAKNSSVDRELLFQIVLATLDKEAMKKAAPVALVARTSVVEDPAVRQPHWPAATATVEAGARSLPHLDYMQATLAAVRPHLAGAVSGRQTSERALKAAAADVNNIVAKNQ